jgi:anti-anti-sigma factor
MEVKTSTKEKFHVITVDTASLSVNMTEDLCRQLLPLLEKDPRNVVFNMQGVQALEEEGAETLVRTQQQFYEAGASFVICCMEPELETFLDSKDLLELMNTTPTESEAWDIVQMEEIERELLDDEE